MSFQHTWPRVPGMLESLKEIAVHLEAFSLLEKGLRFAEDICSQGKVSRLP
jgi:hypothetical protein